MQSVKSKLEVELWIQKLEVLGILNTYAQICKVSIFDR